MQRTKKKHMFDIIFVLLLLVVFAFASFLLVSIGAGVYSSIVNTTEDIYQTRTSLSYVSNKVRYSNIADVSLERVAENDVLVIKEANSVGETYYLMIYFYDGKLMEQAVLDYKDNPNLSYGQVIIDEIKDFTMKREGAMLILTCTSRSGKVQTMTLYVPTQVEAGEQP